MEDIYQTDECKFAAVKSIKTLEMGRKRVICCHIPIEYALILSINKQAISNQVYMIIETTMEKTTLY